jgi:hypothetical protein
MAMETRKLAVSAAIRGPTAREFASVNCLVYEEGPRRPVEKLWIVP